MHQNEGAREGEDPVTAYRHPGMKPPEEALDEGSTTDLYRWSRRKSRKEAEKKELEPVTNWKGEAMEEEEKDVENGEDAEEKASEEESDERGRNE